MQSYFFFSQYFLTQCLIISKLTARSCSNPEFTEGFSGKLEYPCFSTMRMFPSERILFSEFFKFRTEFYAKGSCWPNPFRYKLLLLLSSSRDYSGYLTYLLRVCSFWSILDDMNSARCKCFKCCVLFGQSAMFYFWTAFESFSFASRVASNPRLLFLEFLELFSSMKNTILSSRDASQIDG